MNDLIPAFADKYDKDIQEGLEPLPSFVMVKTMHVECRKMLKERQEQKDNVKKRKSHLTKCMQSAEASVGVGLHAVHLTPTKPSKNSLHSTNICLGEDPTTIAALKSDGEGKKNGNSNDDSPFTSVQDSMKTLVP